MECSRVVTAVSLQGGKESTVLVKGRNQEDTRGVHAVGRSLGECGRDRDCVTNKEEKRRRDTTPLTPDLKWSGKRREEEEEEWK